MYSAINRFAVQFYTRAYSTVLYEELLEILNPIHTTRNRTAQYRKPVYHKLSNIHLTQNGGRYSEVGVATCHKLDGSGIESWWRQEGFLFSIILRFFPSGKAVGLLYHWERAVPLL